MIEPRSILPEHLPHLANILILLARTYYGKEHLEHTTEIIRIVLFDRDHHPADIAEDFKGPKKPVVLPYLSRIFKKEVHILDRIEVANDLGLGFLDRRLKLACGLIDRFRAKPIHVANLGRFPQGQQVVNIIIAYLEVFCKLLALLHFK